jgi:pyruvate-formate lyase-activating enzyme
MAASTPLQGFELIDCARANGSKGIEVAAQRCGYGTDLDRFEQELKRAGDAIAVDIQSFDDLVSNSQDNSPDRGVEIGPDSQTQL